MKKVGDPETKKEVKELRKSVRRMRGSEILTPFGRKGKKRPHAERMEKVSELEKEKETKDEESVGGMRRSERLALFERRGMK